MQHPATGRLVPQTTSVSQLSEDVLVPVQREWNGWRLAHVRLADLEDLHWLQPSGAPQALLHAYVWCSKIASGTLTGLTELADSERGTGVRPESHLLPNVYSTLASRAIRAV